jgi:RHS repeat-associated protein
MTTALEHIRAWQAVQSAGGAVLADHGLPLEVRIGQALSCYTWEAGELCDIVEPDGTRFHYDYGADGRLVSVRRNDCPWADFRYDATGRLTEVARPDGPLVHAYDEQGRLVRTLRGDASPFVYRWDGDWIAAVQSDREDTRLRYDALGRLIGFEQIVDGHRLAVAFNFDGGGRLIRVDFPDWQQTIGYRWDARGRPAAVAWNGRELARFGTDDATRLAWRDGADNIRNDTWSDPRDGRAIRQALSRDGREFWCRNLVRDDAFRLVREGTRSYAYDTAGRLSETRDGDHVRHYAYDAMDDVIDDAGPQVMQRDAAGRITLVRCGSIERVFRYNQQGEMLDALVDGTRVARCLYDHKGRLVLKAGPGGTERYFYGADDALLAMADGDGRPRLIFLRLPTGIIGMVDFRAFSEGEAIGLHCDTHGNLVFASRADGRIEGPFDSDSYGVPLRTAADIPYLYRGRVWHSELGLYWIGWRWYDPSLQRFLTPDCYTGAPDDARLVNPFRNARDQRMARTQILGGWLRQPRLRNRHAYCANDPVNRFDPNGHWSFGGVLLSLLGVLWTLPNTVFGLAIEISCLLGEVVRWLVWLFSAGHVSWQTPGFDVAASGRLNAFALVFKGGWIGSFDSLLGITFGNVIFVNGEYETHPAWQALHDPVAPPAYGGFVTIPKSQARYEHELRHVNQYGWWGPFFHLGLPLFGIYEWDVILNGYHNASLEKDARDYGGF